MSQVIRARGKRAPRFDPRIPAWAQVQAHHGRDRAVRIPSAQDWSQGVDRSILGTLGNAYDPTRPERPVIGDCGIVAMYRIIQMERFATGRPVPTDTQLWPCVLQAYCEIGRYVLGDPSTDQGVVLIDALRHWLTVGLPLPDATRHRCVGYFQLDIRNPGDLRQAIAEAGNIYSGQVIPSAYDSAAPGALWDVAGDGDGGHCTPSFGYRPNIWDMDSWNMEIPETEAARVRYMDESYVVVLADWSKASGITPCGMTLDQVEAAMEPLKAAA